MPSSNTSRVLLSRTCLPSLQREIHSASASTFRAITVLRHTVLLSMHYLLNQKQCSVWGCRHTNSCCMNVTILLLIWELVYLYPKWSCTIHAILSTSLQFKSRGTLAEQLIQFVVAPGVWDLRFTYVQKTACSWPSCEQLLSQQAREPKAAGYDTSPNFLCVPAATNSDMT